MSFHRTVKELREFLQKLPDDLIVRGYEGEDIGIAFDEPPERGEDVGAWFSSTDVARDSLPEKVK